MIPLYLDAVATPLQVGLDGPALRIRQPAAADRLVPLRRLGRIVARGPVAWSGEALTACLAAGVALSLLDGDGRSVGVCLPTVRRAGDLPELIDEALALGAFEAVRNGWLGAAGRAAVLRLLQRLPLRVDDLRPRTVRRALLNRLDRIPAPLAAEDLVARVEALVLAAIGGWLLEEGAGARFQGADPELDLRRDLAELMGWEAWPVTLRLADYLARHPGKHADATALQRRIVRQLEGTIPELRRAFVRHVGLLRRCLRERLA